MLSLNLSLQNKKKKKKNKKDNMTNKIAIFSNLNIVEKYIKDLNDIDLNNIMSLRLPQSKSYLKILGILYFLEDTNLSVMPDIIKIVIKCIHIFNNIVLASYP